MSSRRRSSCSRGRWMIEQERCRIPMGTPPPIRTGAQIDLGEGIESVLRGLHLDGANRESELAQAWPELVGPQIAAHTRPGHMRERELVVYVDSSVWLHELSRYGVKRIQANVQQHVGPNKVRSVRLQLDPEGLAGRSRQ